MIEASQPQAEQSTPYTPAGPPEPLIFEAFEGINTATLRPGVGDNQAAWLDGFMPLGPMRNLRTMYGVSAPLFTSSAANTVAFFDFGNIRATPFSAIVQSDGSIVAVNTTTGSASTIAPAGTIQNPSRVNVGFAQYGSQYFLIVSKQANGYFIWDGTTFYAPGGIGPTISVSNGGSGYMSAPTVSITGGSGTGATATATISGGIVTSLQITNPGTGYQFSDLPSATPPGSLAIAFSGGGGTGAAAKVTAVMPTAISGTAIETYTGRVWITNGPTITFSAPGSQTDFSSGNGGGNFTSNDSFLRVGYTQLKQTNGFLYLIADSSVNYISGVQTSGSPPVTTFTNQNADPEVGTPWPSTVDVFNRNILFANPFGAHVSYGGAVTKTSEMLDGVYNTVANFGNIVPSAAKAIIFGKKVWMLLLPIIDPVTGQQVNKLLLYRDGGQGRSIWWASQQDVNLIYIQFQEINSVLTAWGTDGKSVFQLFAQPSVNFTKTAQTKLWDKPGGYQFTKFVTRLWGIVKYYSSLSPTLNVSLDNEISSNSSPANVSPNPATWLTAGGLVSTWLTVAGVDFGPDFGPDFGLPAEVSTWLAGGASAYSIFQPDAVAQEGVLTGFTLTTNAADMAIVSMMIQDSIAGYRG